MKTNFLMGFLTVVAALLCLAGCDNNPEQVEAEHNYYPTTAVVREVDYDDDIVVVEDSNNQLWIFQGAEDWIEGDVSSIIMDDMGTPEVADDEIIMSRFSGTVQNLN